MSSVVDADALPIPLVKAVDTFFDFDLVMPTQAVEFADITEFAEGAVGLGGVPAQRTTKTDFLDDVLGSFADADFATSAHVDVAVAHFSQAIGIGGGGCAGGAEVDVEQDVHTGISHLFAP